jgi:DNA-binding PadR family transcriptional regulator
MREDDSWRHHDEESRHRRGGGGRRGGGHGSRPGPAGRPGFGMPPGMPWLGDPRMMRGPRAKRGDVRAAALALLTEGPMNGYQIIQAIGERSGDVWRPSPGSVYPALQQLEDEGLIRAEEGNGGRRAYVLTGDGRHYADTHAAELDAPWEAIAGHGGGAAAQMRALIGQLAMAATQVLSAGTDRQVAEARKILTDSRRALYRLLAAEEGTDEGPAPGEPDDAQGGGED